jgi:hypothetical protein
VPFTAPATGGAAISSYTVTSSSGNTGTGSSSPISVSETVGNPTSTARTYTVTATNANGTGSASSASNSIAAVSVPQAPTIGAATAGDASATVAYTANATGGAAVSTFTATSSPGGLTGTGASPITVSGLTNGTAYTFTVTATNSAGTSAASSASSSVTPVVPPSFESIATATGTGSSGTITFSSIPGTYKNLQIRYNGRCDRAGVSLNDLFMTVNSDTGANYTSQELNGNGTSVSASVDGPSTRIILPNSTPGAQAAASIMGVGIIDFQDYSSTSKRKTVRAMNGADANGGSSRIYSNSGVWTSNSAITSISFTAPSSNFTTSTIFSLYGIKG